MEIPPAPQSESAKNKTTKPNVKIPTNIALPPREKDGERNGFHCQKYHLHNFTIQIVKQMFSMSRTMNNGQCL